MTEHCLITYCFVMCNFWNILLVFCNCMKLNLVFYFQPLITLYNIQCILMMTILLQQLILRLLNWCAFGRAIVMRDKAMCAENLMSDMFWTQHENFSAANCSWNNDIQFSIFHWTICPKGLSSLKKPLKISPKNPVTLSKSLSGIVTGFLERHSAEPCTGVKQNRLLFEPGG